MKKTLYLLFLVSTFTFAQTIKGIITNSPLKGIGDATELSEKAKKVMYFSYVYSKKTSRQELISKEETTIDTVIITHDEYKDIKKETTKAVIRSFKTIYFKDYNEDIYRLESSRKNRYMTTEHISIKDKIEQFNWVLSKDTLNVAGYLCKKATATRIINNRKQNLTAWYSDALPINDGPTGFNGLPGLILQVEIDNNTLIKFEKLKFFKENSTITTPKNEAPLLTIKQYYRKAMLKN